jgi:hypothetical protein
LLDLATDLYRTVRKQRGGSHGAGERCEATAFMFTSSPLSSTMQIVAAR